MDGKLAAVCQAEYSETMKTMAVSDSAPRGPRKEIQLSLRAFVALLGVLILPWVLIVFLRLSLPAGCLAYRTPDNQLREGPWGRLEINDIAISPVEVQIPGQPGTPLPNNWFFEGYGAAQLMELFHASDLTAAQQADFLATNTWSVATNGITLHPSDETILGLAPAVRMRLYDILGGSTANQDYFEPWSIKAKLFETRLAKSGLRPDVQDAIRQMAYAKGSRIFFSDLPVILNRLVDADDQRRVVRFLNTASTYQVQLDVPPGADTDALAAYWEIPGRRKDLKPILESLSQLPNGGKLDIAHLLPAFARQRLYIYPSPILAQDGVRRDCHWTSLNFFSLVPDDRLGNTEEAARTILANYYQTGTAPQFGDLALFMLPGGNSIHSAVVLAGNLAFTKNGDSLDQPWIIMDIDEIRELYGLYHKTTLGVQYWRLK